MRRRQEWNETAPEEQKVAVNDRIVEAELGQGRPVRWVKEGRK